MGSTLRTAIELKQAIDSAAKHRICLSKVAQWKEEHGNEQMADEEEEDSDDRDDEDTDTKHDVNKDIGIKVMNKIYDLRRKSDLTVESGEIENLSSTIKVTRAGYEYEGNILTEDEDHVAGRLKEWYEAGAVSGYGDVKAQETKIDPKVRNAREFPANEVSISPDLLSKVEELWDPSMHLYGPGGKFRAHRDTPETDLVGTFLVGLGDTCKVAEDSVWNPRGALKVQDKSTATGWTRYLAEPGSWVAFYPDVEHSVLEIESGYRAVIAFKIFRQVLDIPEVPADVALRSKLQEQLVKIKGPYGILLDHHYPTGTAELNGFDAMVHAAAGETGDAKLLPMLVRFNAESWGEDHFGSFCHANVYPFTETHIAALIKYLKEKGDYEEKQKPKPLFVDLKGTDAEWIHNHSAKTISFYSPSFDATTVVWNRTEEKAVEYTGNEALPDREDGIYLSYAVVVVPSRGTKRRGEAQGGKEDSEEGGKSVKFAG